MESTLQGVHSINSSENTNEFSILLDFLIKVRNFIRLSQTTEFNIDLISNTLKSLTVEESQLEKHIPAPVLWKCFDQIGVVPKVEKYSKLLLEVFIQRFEDNKEDFQRLAEWYNRFIELKDCILVFCSEKKYVNVLMPAVKNFVGALLKKMRQVNSKSYPKEIFVNNLYVNVVTQFLPSKALMNPIIEEIMKNTEELLNILNDQKSAYLSEQTVNITECLNRYFDTIEAVDTFKLRKMDIKQSHDFKLMLKKIIEIKVLPKHFLIRVLKMLDTLQFL